MRRNAFTLIELLVVISIIVLLIGILIPALGMARKTGQAAACLSNLRQAGVGFATYAADFEDYIAGPNTSGLQFYRPLTAADRSWVASDGPSQALQADDWMSPTIGLSLGAPGRRADRLLHFFNHEFRCPANTKKYDAIFGSGAGFPAPGTVNYNSYSAPHPLHAFTNQSEMRATGQSEGAFLGPNDQAVNIGPSKHRFRMHTLGSPSLKAAALDGARYINGAGQVSFNINRVGEQYGQNFMTRSPVLNVFYQDTGSPYKFASASPSVYPRIHEFSRLYAYRHPDESVNIAFFDGHAARFKNVESRRVDFYYPKGSVVADPNELGDRTVQRGYIVK